MRITFSPIAGLPREPETSVSVEGDVLTVDGVDYDLTAIPEGGEASFEGEHPFVGPASRQGGEVRCTVAYFYDDTTATPDQPQDDAHWVVTQTTGQVSAPIVRKE